MPRMTKDQTRRKLRDAVVAEVVERGFGALSVSGVVERAKVSAGTVYVHFKSKNDMLQKVFLEIKSEFHDIMVQAGSEPNSAAMVRRMWFDMFEFVAAHPSDFLFLEYSASARFLTPEQELYVEGLYTEVSDMLRAGIDDGILADLDPATISLLLVAPAMQLARSTVLTDTKVSQEKVELVFARVWRSIAAENVPAPH